MSLSWLLTPGEKCADLAITNALITLSLLIINYPLQSTSVDNLGVHV